MGWLAIRRHPWNQTRSRDSAGFSLPAMRCFVLYPAAIGVKDKEEAEWVMFERWLMSSRLSWSVDIAVAGAWP